MTHAERQEVFHRDWTARGDCLVERPVDALQNSAVGELRKEPIDRLIERELAVLDEHHRCRGEDRLGHRRDAKYRVAPHRVVAAERFRPDHIDVHVLITSHERDDAGKLALRDADRHRFVQMLKTGLRFGIQHHSSNADGLGDRPILSLRVRKARLDHQAKHSVGTRLQ